MVDDTGIVGQTSRKNKHDQNEEKTHKPIHGKLQSCVPCQLQAFSGRLYAPQLKSGDNERFDCLHRTDNIGR